MTPKVPTSESGTAMLGMAVAQTLRRKAKTTRMTSRTAMTRVISISRTEARMVVVRSCETLIRIEGGMEACRKGKSASTRSTSGDGVGGRLLIDLNEDRGLAVHRSGIQPVELTIDHLGYIGEAHWGPVVIGNDQRRIFPGDEKLVIVVQNETAVLHRPASPWGHWRWLVPARSAPGPG